MRLLGYSDRLSVEPGETISFMISSSNGRYRADVVRLIHGDANPDGPGYRADMVPASIAGVHEGRHQPLRIGSHAVVPDNPELDGVSGLTLQMWIMPTLPGRGEQAFISKRSLSGVGYWLGLDEDGAVRFEVDDGGVSLALVTQRCLRPWTWYFVAAVYESPTGRIRLRVDAVESWRDDDSPLILTSDRASISTAGMRLAASGAEFLIGGAWTEDEYGVFVGDHFDGKIGQPRLFGRALDDSELDGLRTGKDPLELTGLVASWDFSIDPSASMVRDISGNDHHGRLVNRPTRAVTGHNWARLETRFSDVPDQYGAIHFHRDDLDDAGWDTSIMWSVPDDIPSGVYALRLQSGGDEDHLPFCVRPRRGTQGARVVLVLPTFTYLAYGNEQLLADPEIRGHFEDGGASVDYPVLPEDRYIVENGLLSCYDTHLDGSGVMYSSWLRPLLNMRPSYDHLVEVIRGTERLRQPHLFPADLHVVDWLHNRDYEFNVVTDADLHHEGVELLRPYRVVISGTHHEYWTAPMMAALEAYLGDGGRFMSLGANGFYWVTAFDGEHAVEIRRFGPSTRTWESYPGEWYMATTGELGGLWRFRGRAPQRLMGVGFTAQGLGDGRPYHRADGGFHSDTSFVFEGVGEDEVIGAFPSLVQEGGPAGFEVDRVDERLGTPPGTFVLATASGFSDRYQLTVDDVLMSDSLQGGSVNPGVRADMTLVWYPNGGAVFSTGSVAWSGSLSFNGYCNNVSRITANVLDRFLSSEPL